MADRCWRCGAATAERSRFCAHCGAQTRVADADIELFDDRAEVAETARVDGATDDGRRSLIMVGAALIAVLVGFYVVTGSERDPSPDDAFGDRAADDAPTVDGGDPGTASTDRAPRRFGTIEGPLAWRPVATDLVGFPVAVTTIDGRTFVHLTDPPVGFASGSAGARTVEILGDDDWIDHGPMFDSGRGRLATVIEGTDGLVATGVGPDGTPMLWRSDDATNWVGEALAAPPRGSANTSPEPVALAEADGTVVAAGAPVDPWVVVARRLAARYGERRWAAYPDLLPGTDAVLVRGPFGLVLETLDLESVGVEGPVIDSLVDVPIASAAWVASEGASSVEWVDGQVIDLETAPDGTIIRSVGTPDRVIHDRLDGPGWTPVTTDADVWDIEPAADGFVGVVSGNQLVTLSDDLDVIEEIVAPGAGRNAFINTLVTGDRGFAVAIAEWVDDPDAEADPVPRVVILRDGFTLSVDQRRRLQLARGDETIVSVTDRPSADADTHRTEWTDGDATVTFVDPATGEDLVVFTFDELAELEAATTPARVRPRQVVSILYADDDGGWHGGELSRPSPTSNVFTLLHVDDDRILALIVGSRAPTGPSGAGGQRTFDVLEAPLP